MLRDNIARERSAGFIVYRNDGERLYLIIQQRNLDWGFPKGHIESGESEAIAAERELLEETGITVKPIHGFVRRISYPIGGGIIKEVTYYLGEALSQDIRVQASELADAEFLCYADALQRLSFESTREILRDAEEYLNITER